MKRKYALTRLGKGDYLLLANDGKTLWRISKYTEDGSAYSGDGRQLVGQFWGTWRYKRPVDGNVTIDAYDWSDFDMDACLLKTRQEAVDDALSSSAAF